MKKLIILFLLFGQTISLLSMNDDETPQTRKIAPPIQKQVYVKAIHKKTGDFFVDIWRPKMNETIVKTTNGLHINESDDIWLFRVCLRYMSNKNNCNKISTILENKQYLYVLKKNKTFLPLLLTDARTYNQPSIAIMIEDALNQTNNSSTKNSK